MRVPGGDRTRRQSGRRPGRQQQRLDLTVRFLQDTQNPDGGFGGTRGAPSDPTFSAWVALALAAAGINPRDQARPGGVDAYGYLTAHASELSATTDFERAALVAVAAGASPRDFGGVDLVAAILTRQLPSGAFAGQAGATTGYVNATAFALLPLSALREPALEPRCAAARTGSWASRSRAALGASRPAASRAATRPPPSSRRCTPSAAAAHRRRRERGTGCARCATPTAATASTPRFRSRTPPRRRGSRRRCGRPGRPGGRAAGGGPSALDYLAAMQRPDGSIAWRAGEEANAVWMTAYAAPAYAGRPLPIAAVPRAAPTAPDPPAPAEPVAPPPAAAGTRRCPATAASAAPAAASRSPAAAGTARRSSAGPSRGAAGGRPGDRADRGPGPPGRARRRPPGCAARLRG